MGSAYIKLQYAVNSYKKRNSSHWFFKNPYFYTCGVTFMVLNIIFFLRLMQTGDKQIIKAMIDIDENLAEMKMNQTNYQEKMNAKFDFSYKVMEDVNTWLLFDGYLVIYLI